MKGFSKKSITSDSLSLRNHCINWSKFTMACALEGDDEECSVNTKRPQFFKIIPESTLLGGKLRLPVKFVKKYGKEVSSPVQLKVPNGDEWSIRIRRRGGEIWLQKGFRSFMEHYSLSYGSLLVFEYVGNCIFNVHIFDESATEISYPFKNEEFKGDISSDASVEIIGPCSMPSKTMSTSHAGKAQKGMQDGGIEKIRPLTDKEKVLALQRASDVFTSNQPFFMVAIQPSNVRGYKLHIPAKFANRYLQKLKVATVKLQVADTWWLVKIVKDRTNSGVFFSAGWSEFVRQNHLQVGDVCAFEQMTSSDKTLLFDVCIFRFGC